MVTGQRGVKAYAKNIEISAAKSNETQANSVRK